MPRSIPTLLIELEATMAELRQALEPLSRLSAAFAGGDGPFPMKPAPARKAASPKSVAARAAAPKDAAAPKKPRGRRPGVKAVLTKAAPEMPAAPALVEAPAPAEAAPAAPKAPKQKRKPSPRMALQGKYMVALRKLSKADQAEVKRIRAEQGIEAALRAAATAAA